MHAAWAPWRVIKSCAVPHRTEESNLSLTNVDSVFSWTQTGASLFRCLPFSLCLLKVTPELFTLLLSTALKDFKKHFLWRRNNSGQCRINTARNRQAHGSNNSPSCFFFFSSSHRETEIHSSPEAVASIYFKGSKVRPNLTLVLRHG